MAVTQYIGSRYVPLFADPIEWSASNTYEPLTIVIHEGNSYTSKQAVPADIDISNEAFWALTGNYNAQVELYRRETALAKATADDAQADADAAQADIDTLLPKADFSAVNTVKKYVDDSVASVAELMPSTDFSAENTIKKYVDDSVSAVADILPLDFFDAANTVKKYVDDSIVAHNQSYVGSYGAQENNPDVDWADVLDKIADVSDTVYFGSGSWDLGEGIEIPSTIKNVFGNGATLYTSADDTPDYLVNVNAITRFSGLNFTGDGKVNKLLSSLTADAGNRLQVDDCNFNNVGRGNFAIYNEYIGLMCNACRFNNSSLYPGGTAIKTHTDNIVNGCKFFRFDFDIAAFGVNCNNCYFWHTTDTQGCVFVPEFWDNRQAFNEQVGLHYDIIATNCEFDCIKKLVVNPVNCVIHNNHFYWNDRDLTDADTVYLFFLSGTYVNMNSIDFSFNIFKFQTISYDVYQFGNYAGTQGTNNAGQVNRYHSMCNVYTDNVYSLTNIAKYHLMCGWISQNYMRSGSQNYWCHCTAPHTTRTNSNQTLNLRSNENFWEYDIVNGAHQMTIKNAVARQAILVSNHAYYKSDTVDMWFTALPFTFQEVEIKNGALMMFDMIADVSSESPDVTGYTEVSPSKIQYAS